VVRKSTDSLGVVDYSEVYGIHCFKGRNSMALLEAAVEAVELDATK
jgi:hypothetical protein